MFFPLLPSECGAVAVAFLVLVHVDAAAAGGAHEAGRQQQGGGAQEGFSSVFHIAFNAGWGVLLWWVEKKGRV